MKLMPMLVLAALALAACQNDTGNIEKDLQDLKRDVAELKATCGRGGPGVAQQQQRRPEPDRSKTYSVAIDGDPFEGPADAKVTIVKAYDYACPFCARVRPTMDSLRQKYGNDVRIVYKQFVVHPQVATAGALAFCAANKQGKAMEMDKLLWDQSYENHKFDKDGCWTGSEGCEIVDGYAQQLGLDVAKFRSDMKGDCQQLKEKDMRELGALGVSATPSFFINGRFIVGAAALDQFAQIVDEELKKANERLNGQPATNYYQEWVVDKGQKTL